MMMKLGMRQVPVRLITKLRKRGGIGKRVIYFLSPAAIAARGGKACFQPLTLRLMQELLQLFDGSALTLKLHAKTNNWTIE